MRRLAVVLCGVVLAVTACGDSGGDASRATTEAEALPLVMADNGFMCDDVADTETSDFYNGYYGIPHRKLDCNKGGDAGTAVRFFIWDDGEADEASYPFTDQFCGLDQDPTYIVGVGWGATVTTTNATTDETVIDEDGMSQVTDAVGGEIISPFC